MREFVERQDIFDVRFSAGLKLQHSRYNFCGIIFAQLKYSKAFNRLNYMLGLCILSQWKKAKNNNLQE